MASQNDAKKALDGYKYEEMSGKIYRSDRKMLDNPKDRERERGKIYEPTSLIGKVSVKDMGSAIAGRSQSSKLSEQEIRKADREIEKQTKATKNGTGDQKKTSSRTSNYYGSSRDITSVETLLYVPTSDSNRKVFDLILTWCSKQLDDDVSHDIILSLADILLEFLKDESLSDLSKKEKVESTLEKKLDDNDFRAILDLSKQISDYSTKDPNDIKDEDEEEFAVVINSDDEDEDEQDVSGIEDEDIDEDGGNDTGNINDDYSEEHNESTYKESGTPSDGTIKLGEENDDESTSKLKITSIDKFWLTRQISKYFKDLDSYKHTEWSNNIFSLLEDLVNSKIDLRTFENDILELFDFESSDLVILILKNYYTVYYGIRLSSCNNNDEAAKQSILNEMKSKKLDNLVNAYTGITLLNNATSNEANPPTKKVKLSNDSVNSGVREPKYIDINNLVFDQGSHLMTQTKFQLPKGSFKRARKSFEEIHIPAPKQPSLGENERLIEINELPDWAQTVFPSNETKTLNRIQSKVYPTAFWEDENLLMCAPTGAGKTNVAMLTVLRTISKYRDPETGILDLQNFKIVYIAPLKALVQEQVREFERRLSHFNITVNELTGDSNLTKHQISNTQILVTTPEKWDVITRKMSDISYVNLVRLIIIDEIHLLHDERGPVLESIVSRSLRNDESSNEEPVRLVGLSATLPNYKDVASFLRIDPKKGLFFFDATYRPCPLAQQFIGITEKKSLKQYQAMIDVCYEKVLESVGNGHQVIIFVHSRKETEKTAKQIVEKLIETERLNEVVKLSPGIQEILKTESENAKHQGLKSLLPMGFAIHHAGMNKQDRSTSEDLFAQGYIQVLVSTATLAWGVNLPAHTVIVKGTTIYSPEKGTWVQISPQDILQMLGRAGRPRYDKSGEGIIITTQDEVKYYLAVLNQQLPIESQLMSRLADNLNAEVVLGTVKSREEASKWLTYTYLYVRMLRDRALYHVGPDYDNDKTLTLLREDLAHSALTILAKNGLVNYDPVTGVTSPTDLGKIASHYYISYESMKVYNKQMKAHMTEIDIFRLFCQSGEFKYISVRQEEKLEIVKLLDKAPIPINESAEDPLAKVNVLLQANISNLQLDGVALMSDMIFVVQSAGRLFRAMFEIAMMKGWARLTRNLLNLCKMVEKKLWMTNSPLRQFPQVPRELIISNERSMTPWSHYLRLTDQAEVAQAFKSEKFGRLGFELLQKFPQLSIEVNSQPISASLLHVELEVTPKWNWDVEIHGFSESFTLLVEDCDSQSILYYNTFIVRKEYINQYHYIDFTVPLTDILQPNYFVSLISDRWLHCETRAPIMLTNIKVPKKFPAPTQLLNLQPIPVSDLKIEEFTKCFKFENFNKFQSQVFSTLYLAPNLPDSTQNVLVGSSKGTGKTVMAELALLRHWKLEKERAVYISPYQEQIDTLTKVWRKKFGKIAGGKSINKLTGELTSDLKLLASSHLILATPEQFDLISRRWQQRRNVQAIELLIADDAHFIGSGRNGTIYEIILSRMRFVGAQLESGLRIVALASSLANGRDFGEWLGVTKNNIYNFASKERINPVEIKFQTFEINHNPSLVLAMTKPTYNAINQLDEDKGEDNCIVFVPSRKHCVDISAEFIKLMAKDEISWLRTDLDSIESYLAKIRDLALKEALTEGIGFFYKNMAPSDKNIVEKLFNAGALSCLLASKETAHWCPTTNFVTVLSTQEYEGREHRYVDYTVNDLLEMIGVAKIENSTANVLILTNSFKAPYFKKFLLESLPIESHLNLFLHDAFINEISTQLIKNRQDSVDWITHSYFYRRLQMNPSFYGVTDTSEVGLSEYLSELVENTLKDLVEGKIIELSIDENKDEDAMSDEEDEEIVEITPLNGCMISAYHNVSFISMQTFTLSLNSNTKLRKLLEVITSAYEFESIPIRAHEDELLMKIYNRIPAKTNSVDYSSPSFKSFILLQAHLNRMSLPPDLAADLKVILEKVLSLIYAVVDILSSEGYLNAMNAMDLSQMIVQGLWDTGNPLKQIPFFSDDIIEKCKEKQLETVYDVMALEDEERDEVMGTLTEAQLNSVAEFVNKYPNLELSYDLDLNDPIVSNEAKAITVTIQRDEDPEDLTVVAPRFPYTKSENWWLVIGDSSKKQLYTIKKLTVAKESQVVKLQFTIPEAGHHNLSIWCMCDSYIDADKEITFEVDVEQGDEEED